MESEFRKKILAEKGQIEIILNNRISGINAMLKNLGSDNIIRVTILLDNLSQLEERISELYPAQDGVYFFVMKQGEDNPLFKLIREHGVVREFPLVVSTVKAFSEGKIRITADKQVVDAEGKPIKGYDLTAEINNMLSEKKAP